MAFYRFADAPLYPILCHAEPPKLRTHQLATESQTKASVCEETELANKNRPWFAWYRSWAQVTTGTKNNLSIFRG